ncbi:unnamed protein product [Orchesella dallaii]|uniref:Arrestin C-terminal-like domain-containing protein n=2 Tax=Orchesella dallaii TaxID=48710 RepID=A0ABP1QU20_9HEXA
MQTFLRQQNTKYTIPCKTSLVRNMNVKLFSVQLDNSSRTYFAGQYITGKIIIGNDTEVKTRGIALRFSGTASVAWMESVEEGSGDSLRSVVKQHANKEIYMDEELYAFGRAGEPEDLIIQPGHHEYPFTYQLPPNVPSTFKYDQGQIHANVTYIVEAKIKRSAWKSDHKTSLEFFVKAVMNVNRYSQASQPVVVFKEKHLCCFCCKDGPITMNIKMAKTGYFPGDTMSFSVDVVNLSSKRITGIDAVLEQETKFVSTSMDHVKVFHELVMKAQSGPSVESSGTENWVGEVTIPDVLPTNLGGCHIVLRSYTLKINANIALSRGLKAVVPVVIGSAPKKIGHNQDDSQDIKSYRNSPSPTFHDTYRK